MLEFEEVTYIPSNRCPWCNSEGILVSENLYACAKCPPPSEFEEYAYFCPELHWDDRRGEWRR